jgi:hypothetical protein
VFAFLLVSALGCEAQARKWPDNTGNCSVEAELVERRGDEIVLRNSTGVLITVPIAGLPKSTRHGEIPVFARYTSSETTPFPIGECRITAPEAEIGERLGSTTPTAWGYGVRNIRISTTAPTRCGPRGSPGWRVD